MLSVSSVVPPTTIRRVAIVGASVRAAAQSAAKAGYEVVAADLFADADLRSVATATRIDDYPAGLASWLAAQPVDAWCYTGALENHPELIDRMAAIRPLWGTSGASQRELRDPVRLHQALTAAGVGVAEALALGQAPPAGGEWLAKTYAHSAGAGVWPYGSQPAEATVYAQRRLAGETRSAVLAIGPTSSALLGVTEQLVEGFAYRGSIGPVVAQPAETTSLRRVGEALRTTFAARGVVGVDYLVAGGSAIVIEVNARLPASLEVIENAHGRSAFCEHAACFASDLTTLTDWASSATNGAVCGKRIVYATRDTVVTEAFVDWAEAERRGRRLADVPTAGEPISAGAPVCTVLTTGRDTSAGRVALDASAAEVLARLEVSAG